MFTRLDAAMTSSRDLAGYWRLEGNGESFVQKEGRLKGEERYHRRREVFPLIARLSYDPSGPLTFHPPLFANAATLSLHRSHR